MVSIPDLWLPIAVASALVFLVSSVLHMVLTYHRLDYKKLPDEEGLLEPLRRAALPPGLYHFPWCATSKEMGSPEMQERFRRGPVGFVSLYPSGPPKMGKFLGLWFVFCVLVSVFVAYLTGRALVHGAIYLAVFRFAGATAFMAYGVSHVADSIWKGQPWSNTFRALADGLVYSLVTAGVFGWLWPR
jgi:hypothetical protein